MRFFVSSSTPWCFSLTIGAWLFKGRMNECRDDPLLQAHDGKSDLRCSALLPLLLLLSLCSLLQLADPLVWGTTGGRPRGLAPVPSRLVCGDCSFLTPACNVSASFFVCQTCALYQWDGREDFHKSIITINMSHTFITLSSFVFVVKKIETDPFTNININIICANINLSISTSPKIDY